MGSDHNGLVLKEQVKGYLIERGYEVVDYGTVDQEPIDYQT
jgi:ribose 5-phosphate isomerase B